MWSTILKQLSKDLTHILHIFCWILNKFQCTRWQNNKPLHGSLSLTCVPWLLGEQVVQMTSRQRCSFPLKVMSFLLMCESHWSKKSVGLELTDRKMVGLVTKETVESGVGLGGRGQGWGQVAMWWNTKVWYVLHTKLEKGQITTIRRLQSWC